MPRTPRVFRSSSLSPVLMSALLLAGLACACAGPPPPPPNGGAHPCPPPFARVDVTVPPDGGALEVEPWQVKISRCFRESDGERIPCPAGKVEKVCWVIGGLQERHTLHIRGKGDNRGTLELLADGRATHPETVLRSAKPLSRGHEPPYRGDVADEHWTYELWITEAGSDLRLQYTDPEVIIRDQWGPP